MPNTHETLTSLFDDIADAIREKTGSSEAIVADTFPAAIRAIPSGGGGGVLYKAGTESRSISKGVNPDTMKITTFSGNTLFYNAVFVPELTDGKCHVYLHFPAQYTDFSGTMYIGTTASEPSSIGRDISILKEISVTGVTVDFDMDLSTLTGLQYIFICPKDTAVDSGSQNATWATLT